MHTRTRWLAPAMAVAMVSGTAQARPLLLSDLPPAVRSLPAAQAPEGEPQAEVRGTASWYGPRHAGHRMSNGARFDPRALTAAHATLPFGTHVEVVREDTGASVEVTITDRIGTAARVLDLSEAAAKKLGMLHRGLAPVRLVVDPSPDDTQAPHAAGRAARSVHAPRL